ncbi:phosphopyruvate hydratase [Patescibacteria group bacterium]|nr:phosphopyruvate hydratase [Patescibacteria group bacterium]
MSKNSQIKSIKAREILNSRGNPTIEVDLTTELGVFRASVPSGASKGKYEAVELRDGDKRYQGMGVLKAVKNVNEIIGPKIKGKDPAKQKEIDELMITLDGTGNKSKLGANAILGVSLAVCRAGAAAKNLALWKWISKIASAKPVLPVPCVLLLEGGLHGKGDLDIQEFMVVIKANSFKERIRIGTEIYHILEEILSKKYGKTAANVGLEGAFTPPVKETKEALDLIMEAAQKAGYKNKIKIILDVAATSFFKEGKYYFEKRILSAKELLDFYLKLCQEYPITAIEDPFAEEDWEAFQEITKRFGSKITVIGDDLLATNIQRIKKAVDKKACNGLILKPNQIGTVSETIAAAKYALENRWQVFVKHRSGETDDDFIADLAVGLGAGWIMAGAPSRGERVIKYNRLLRIEE